MAFNNGNNDDAQAQAQNLKKNLSNPNPSPPPPPQAQNGVSKVKSCRGSLYYSSLRKSKSKSPTCVGFSGTLDQYSSYNVGGAELRASKESKQGMNLANFKYACLGYSIYLDNKNSSADSQNKAPKLPLCVGLQILTLKKPSVSPIGQVPDPACKSEEQEHATPQPQSYKPPHVTEEKLFFNRFKRNASLVASGIGRNLNRVGNYVRERSGPK